MSDAGNIGAHGSVNATIEAIECQGAEYVLFTLSQATIKDAT